jgi:hypothetical protein
MKHLLLPLLVAAIAAPGFAQNARSPQQLDAGFGKAVGPAVATQGDVSAVLWKEDGTNNMYVAVSSDNGNSWGTPVRVDDDTTSATKFAKDVGVVVDGGNIYATWSDDRNAASDADIMFTMSTDGGATWSTNFAIPKGYPSGANDVKDWRLMASGPDVAVVCATENDGGGFNEELFISISTDGGLTFSPAFAVSTHPNGSVDVDAISAAMSNGNVHIAWQDNFSGVNEGFYTRYDISASIFSKQDVLISAGLAGGSVENDFAIAANGSTIAIAMQADNLPTANAHQLNVNVSLDDGSNWNGDVPVGNYVFGVDDTDHPVILVTGNDTIVVACEDNRSGSDELFAHTSTDYGVTWMESMPLGNGGYPAICGDGDYVCINWTGPSYPEGSMAAASRDGGLTWGPAFDLAAGQAGDADYAEMAFNGKYHNFVGVWLDDSATGINELFAGGFRSQGLFGNGPFTAGQPVNFTGSGWGLAETGNTFTVVVSTANGYGSAFLPGDGRDIGIGVSPTLMTSMTLPSLSGTIAADGSASTPTMTMTGRFPIGTSLYCVALSRPAGGFDAISDVVTVVVQ